MTTKNLTKSFQGKIKGQHLPPILIANKQSATNNDRFVPNSILKQNKTDNEEIDRTPRLCDDDDFDTSRVTFQKSQHDDLLLLDTYPPKNWTVPKHLKSSYEHTINQGQRTNPIFDVPLQSDKSPGDLIEAFPSPLSDRIMSSRYCRRSVSSSCSRRSSILYPRHSTIPAESIQLRREETFDTLCESLPDTHRSSYTLLPPIPTNSSIDLTKSLNEPEVSVETHPQLLVAPSKDLKPSLSPPLIAPEQIPEIQKEKEEFTRRLLSKSLRREPTSIPVEKPMDSPTIVQKSAIAKHLVEPRVQKSIVKQRRISSVERQPPMTLNRSKISTAASTTSINQSTPQRLGKVALDIFQPQSKCTTATTLTNKKPILSTNKNKCTTKTNVVKVKINIAPPSPLPTEPEVSQSNNDVIPSPSQQPSTSIEIFQTMNNNNNESEEIQSPTEHIEQVKPDVPKRQSLCRPSSHRPSHPVPKPLTLQGEKTLDVDCPETTRRTSLVALGCGQRRGSLKGQPVIVEMFPDTTEDSQPELPQQAQMQAIRPVTLKFKKPKTNFTKSVKPKKPVVPNKSKASAPVVKTEMKSQSTSTEIDDEPKPNENVIIVGGTDWVMTVKPQIIADNNESVLSQLFDAPTVDDEELPSETSPTDNLAVSQATVMTTVEENDTQRRDSMRSEQAFEISPVLTQLIEQKVESSISDPTEQMTKHADSSLLNSDIRNVYESVRDSIRKDTSLRSLPKQTTDQDVSPTKASLPSTTTSSMSQTKTLPFETAVSIERTYNNSDASLSIRPAFRVVNDSLNSRGSETIESTSSHEDFNLTPLCTENDCDAVYRTARKGRVVGKGAYGTVWSYLTSTGRMIAVKEIELDEGDSERVRNDYESVREEIYILRTLNHPNIVKFLGITLESQHLVKIFMEYLPNGTIETMLQAFGPFHSDVLKKYTKQLVEGVSYLHDNRVVHRDIKGKNIMLDVDGNIKLIDFGCAKRLKKNQNTHSQAQMLKTMKGTVHWMAPEVITESGHGKKADIWSIGCTLCEMATGKPPWSFEHKHVALLLIIANGTRPPSDLPDTYPPAAHDFFRQCLTRDPAQRPSAKNLLLHPFLTS